MSLLGKYILRQFLNSYLFTLHTSLCGINKYLSCALCVLKHLMKMYVDTACAKRISLLSFISELFDFGENRKKEANGTVFYGCNYLATFLTPPPPPTSQPTPIKADLRLTSETLHNFPLFFSKQLLLYQKVCFVINSFQSGHTSFSRRYQVISGESHLSVRSV